jgi:hypothetical protein
MEMKVAMEDLWILLSSMLPKMDFQPKMLIHILEEMELAKLTIQSLKKLDVKMLKLIPKTTWMELLMT